jgi:hypothetical protein
MSASALVQTLKALSTLPVCEVHPNPGLQVFSKYIERPEDALQFAKSGSGRRLSSLDRPGDLIDVSTQRSNVGNGAFDVALHDVFTDRRKINSVALPSLP